MNFRQDNGVGDAPRSSGRVSHEGARNEKAPWLRSSTWSQTRMTRSEGDWLSFCQLNVNRQFEECLRTPKAPLKGPSGLSVIPGGAPPPWGIGPPAIRGLALIGNLGVDTPQTCSLRHWGLRGSTQLGQPPRPLGTSIHLVRTLWTVWFAHSLTLSSVKVKSRTKRRDSNARSDSAVQSDRGGPQTALPHGHHPPGPLPAPLRDTLQPHSSQES